MMLYHPHRARPRLIHTSFFQDLNHAPVLVLANGPGFDHTHTIPDATGILLVMGLELRHPPQDFMINGVHDLTLDRHHDGFVHLVADDPSDPFPPFDFTLSHALSPFAARTPSSAPP